MNIHERKGNEIELNDKTVNNILGGKMKRIEKTITIIIISLVQNIKLVSE